MMARNRSNSMEASLVIWILFVFYFVKSFAEVCRKIDDCTCIKSNGKIISLREIDGGCKGPAFRNITDLNPQHGYLYDWNPCTKFSQGYDCKDTLMCQVFADTSISYPCAMSVADFQVDDNGMTQITYQPVTYSGHTRSVIINLKCDESKFPGEMSSVEEWLSLRSSIYGE
ncbi:uncharacterized protein LOC144661671 isoform X3 [Oculina patagonica]